MDKDLKRSDEKPGTINTERGNESHKAGVVIRKQRPGVWGRKQDQTETNKGKRNRNLGN